MEEGIKQLLVGKDAHEIKEFSLNQDAYAKSGDNSSVQVQFHQIQEHCLDNLVNLEILSITNLGLTSLKNLPLLIKLKKVTTPVVHIYIYSSWISVTI
jgi:hypothetical protein